MLLLDNVSQFQNSIRKNTIFGLQSKRQRAQELAVSELVLLTHLGLLYLTGSGLKSWQVESVHSATRGQVIPMAQLQLLQTRHGMTSNVYMNIQEGIWFVKFSLMAFWFPPLPVQWLHFQGIAQLPLSMLAELQAQLFTQI